MRTFWGWDVATSWEWAIAPLGMAALLVLLVSKTATAATYGANVLNTSGGGVLTWVFFEQPQGGVLGYACEVLNTKPELSSGVPNLPQLNSGITGNNLEGYAFLVRRYAIVADGRQRRTSGRHEVTFALWDVYQGQPNYYWQLVREMNATEESMWTHYAGLEPPIVSIDPGTGWFTNNAPVTQLGRTCVNGGVSAAKTLIEQELGVRFTLHEDTPL